MTRAISSCSSGPPCGIAPDNSQALDALNQVRQLDVHHYLEDDPSLADPRIDLGTMVGNKQVTDFHLVNLAARHAAQVATFDGSLVRALQPDDRLHVHLIAW